MRISRHIASIVIVGAAAAAAPAFAFEGTTPGGGRPAVTLSAPSAGLASPSAIPVPPMPVAAAAGVPAGSAVGVKAAVPSETSLTALQYAAEGGHPIAQWRLGRMYADGDGVARDDLRAFEYFSRIANAYADDSPGTPQARFVANAFVQLGHYYLEGIPNTEVKADPDRAREMYAFAASYFGDADAQYSLARLFLDGKGGAKDPRQALRWLNLAANKGQARAQALLGHLIFKGDVVPRQAARGLMWLTLAREGAGSEKWVVEMYDAAFKQANDSERQMAVLYLENYMKGRRD
jgi:TPR repeat protein